MQKRQIQIWPKNHNSGVATIVGVQLEERWQSRLSGLLNLLPLQIWQHGSNDDRWRPQFWRGSATQIGFQLNHSRHCYLNLVCKWLLIESKELFAKERCECESPPIFLPLFALTDIWTHLRINQRRRSRTQLVFVKRYAGVIALQCFAIIWDGEKPATSQERIWKVPTQREKIYDCHVWSRQSQFAQLAAFQKSSLNFADSWTPL